MNDMKKILYPIVSALALLGLASCTDRIEPIEPEAGSANVYILNEGYWGGNNASLSVYDSKENSVTNDWYSSINGSPLGDVANDIVVTRNFIIIAVNASNIIQICDKDGKSLAQIEDIPNCRKMAVDDGEGYLYVTSYADNGYVAKINLSTYRVEGKTSVGYEPEGIVYYEGNLYIANSGGYAYNGDHGYEQTISVVNAATMVEARRIETGHYNLYGAFLQNDLYPNYILVNAAGDYGENPASSFIFDCNTQTVVDEFDFPATYAAQYEGFFYTIGSNFNYETYQNEYSCNAINMNASVHETIAWNISSIIGTLGSPYGLFIDSGGRIYFSDAGDYKGRGTLYVYDSYGNLLSSQTVGVCPGHFAEK